MNDDHTFSVWENTYPEGFKMVQMRLSSKPHTLLEWRNALWGMDIFLHRVPILKTILALNLVVWVLLWVTR